MITQQKLNNLHKLIDDMDDGDPKTKIIKKLLTHIDDLYDEVIWVKEQNEEMRYKLEDKKIERWEGRNGPDRPFDNPNTRFGQDFDTPF